MRAISSQITSFDIVSSTVYSGADQRKHQSSAPLAFVWGIHRWPVNSPHKWPVTWKMFPFDDVIMRFAIFCALLWFGTGRFTMLFEIIALGQGQPHWRHRPSKICLNASRGSYKSVSTCLSIPSRLTTNEILTPICRIGCRKSFMPGPSYSLINMD